jgi:hypothetical protein
MSKTRIPHRSFKQVHITTNEKKIAAPSKQGEGAALLCALPWLPLEKKLRDSHVGLEKEHKRGQIEESVVK